MAPSIEVMPTPTTYSEPYYSGSLRKRFQLDAAKARGEDVFNTELLEKIQNIPECRDFSYEVNEEKHLARIRRRLAQGGLAQSLPNGFPTRLEGPLVWKAKDFRIEESEFVYHVTEQDKAEIASALEYFKEQGLDGDDVSAATFLLPDLERRLNSVKEDVYDGRGFAIIRGLNPDDYTDEDFAVVYLGITSYIAPHRGKQDQRGSMLMHVMRRQTKDRKDNYNENKPFHTDTVCDVLCLVTKNCSATGGQSIIASARSVYNELAATRPDIIRTLAAADWPFGTYGRNPPYYRRAIMFYDPATGKLITNLSRRLLLGHEPFDPRSPNIPNVSEAQMEALDAMHFAARRIELRTLMQKGDIRLINHMAVLHRREAFEDGDSKEEIRHLIRVWLHNELMCWKLPAPLRLAWARVFEDYEREEHWDLKPVYKDGVVLRVAGSCD